jgi:hypothetical protein
VLWDLAPKFLKDLMLQIPEFIVAALFLLQVLVHSNVDYGASCRSGWKQDRRKFDEMGSLAEQDLCDEVSTRFKR